MRDGPMGNEFIDMLAALNPDELNEALERNPKLREELFSPISFLRGNKPTVMGAVTGLNGINAINTLASGRMALLDEIRERQVRYEAVDKQLQADHPIYYDLQASAREPVDA